MGRSFFLGTDHELYTGSAAFSTQISATPTAFGLLAADATAYAALNTTYAAAYLAATDPATRTKGNVAAKNDAKQALKIMASDLAKRIDGTPTVTDQQKLDLGLSVRATPGPRPAPGAPYKFTAMLDESGVLNLSWKCSSGGGTVYQVWRRIGGVGEFAYLGGAGQKKFTDETLPAGSSQVTYQIQAVRPTGVGAWSQFNVNFGVTSAGTVTTSVTESAPSKIAA